MGFKLVRVDAQEPVKIPLHVGEHIIGRGTFLNCDDHRVSRQHGVIEVTEDAVVLKSLHQNPCFYNKLNLKRTIVLPQGKWVSLSNGDQFGLLPNSIWYELILCDDTSMESTALKSMQQENGLNLTERAVGTTNTLYRKRNILKAEINETTNAISKVSSDTQTYCLRTEDDSSLSKVVKTECNEDEETDLSMLNLEFDEEMETGGDQSQSLICDNLVLGDPTTTNLPQRELNATSQQENPDTTPPEDPNTKPPSEAESDETYCDVQTTPGKRSHSPEPSPDAKKSKTGPERPKKTKSPKEPTTEEAQSTEEANTQRPNDTVRPQSSIDMDTEPQDPNNMSTEPQDPMNFNKEPLSPIDVNTEADSANDTEPECHMDADTEPKSPSNDVKKELLRPDSKKEVKKEPQSPKDEKVVKKEPDVAKPGSSHDQPGSSHADGIGSAPAKPPSGPGRERCMYGSTCYRKNVQHKIQFSHPGDSDYGDGAKGQCPYGAACQRSDPRHWAMHEHPYGTAQPGPLPYDQHNRQGMRVVQRRGQVFYINAHSVHFHDDHYAVEDDDGDSVDYDYEF